jgi:3-mercaptopyruvate sulfurtransferase SseA
VLYGEDQLQVNGPWMLFRQAGFENVKVLLGGYRYYIENKDSLGVVKENTLYLKELQRYDYALSAAPEENSEQVAGGEKKQVTVIKREKTGAAKGGC